MDRWCLVLNFEAEAGRQRSPRQDGLGQYWSAAGDRHLMIPQGTALESRGPPGRVDSSLGIQFLTFDQCEVGSFWQPWQ